MRQRSQTLITHKCLHHAAGLSSSTKFKTNWAHKQPSLSSSPCTSSERLLCGLKFCQGRMGPSCHNTRPSHQQTCWEDGHRIGWRHRMGAGVQGWAAWDDCDSMVGYVPGRGCSIDCMHGACTRLHNMNDLQRPLSTLYGCKVNRHHSTHIVAGQRTGIGTPVHSLASGTETDTYIICVPDKAVFFHSIGYIRSIWPPAAKKFLEKCPKHGWQLEISLVLKQWMCHSSR